MPTMVRNGLKIFIAVALSACAAMQPRDPVQVTVAGLEPLPAEGLEVRMLVKLRVQNPNDVPIEYNGVFVKLDVLDQSFATGVSDERGSVPRFGESVISVPITVSMLRIAAQGVGLLGGGSRDDLLPGRQARRFRLFLDEISGARPVDAAGHERSPSTPSGGRAAAMYWAAPLGDKQPSSLQTVFANSMLNCLVSSAGI